MNTATIVQIPDDAVCYIFEDGMHPTILSPAMGRIFNFGTAVRRKISKFKPVKLLFKKELTMNHTPVGAAEQVKYIYIYISVHIY